MDPDEYDRGEEAHGQNEYPDLDHVPSYPWAGCIHVSSDGEDESEEGGCSLPSNESMSPMEGNRDNSDEILSFVANPANLGHRRYLKHPQAGDNLDVQIETDNTLSDDVLSEAQFTSSVESDNETLDGSLTSRRRGLRNRSRGRGNLRRPFRGGRGGKGIKRGFRRPVDPSPEFKILHSQATVAFIDGKLQRATDLIQEAIGLNPEIYSAHSLLSQIHVATGEDQKALAVLFHGAHTRPRDTRLWTSIAESILERAKGENDLESAIYCLNRVIGAEPSNIKARYRRAELNIQLGYQNKAVHGYERLLQILPYDTTVLRHLAEVCLDIGEIERAIQHYDDSISHYQWLEPRTVTTFSWSDMNIYAELLVRSKKFANGTSRLKALARWLLGRGDEEFWNTVDDDDREFDAGDEPRRAKVGKFVKGTQELSAYGEGLPLELRIKLGVLRLNSNEGDLEEAMRHFKWLNADQDVAEDRLLCYPDLFREVADALKERRQWSEALSYYHHIRRVIDLTDAGFHTDVAACYHALGMNSEAAECYRIVVEHHPRKIEMRMQLVKSLEATGAADEAYKYINNVDFGESQEYSTHSAQEVQQSRSLPNSIADHILQERSKPSHFSMLATGLSRKSHTKPIPAVKLRQQGLEDNLTAIMMQMRAAQDYLSDVWSSGSDEWMKAARILINDFKNKQIFYPLDKHMRFYGYTKEARAKSMKPKASQVADEMRKQTKQRSPGSYKLDRNASSWKPGDDVGDENVVIPTDYRGIQFSDWLDILLQYAILLSHKGAPDEAYALAEKTYEANVFHYWKEAAFCCHVAWFTCALIANNDEQACLVARAFMKDFQFITDGYRLFAAINRVLEGPATYYNSGPSQKYILRQVKAVDFSLVGEGNKQTLYQERASYSTRNSNGNVIHAKDLDVALLMIYGHILYAGTSYSYALNYFFRAYAVDSLNPMVNLSLGLCYVHYSLKRQSDNRHYHILQGFAFLYTYYDIRRSSASLSERQEAEFNLGRIYHMLGLLHLAIPFYQRCLDLSSELCSLVSTSIAEDFAPEAAYSLQGILVGSGDMESAQAITASWLLL